MDAPEFVLDKRHAQMQLWAVVDKDGSLTRSSAGAYSAAKPNGKAVYTGRSRGGTIYAILLTKNPTSIKQFSMRPGAPLLPPRVYGDVTWCGRNRVFQIKFSGESKNDIWAAIRVAQSLKFD